MRGKQTPGLILYKRHSSGCSHTAEKYSFTCPCPIWIHGSLPNGDVLPRQSTSTNNLRVAEAKRDAQLRLYATQAQDKTIYGPRLVECIEDHLTNLATYNKAVSVYQIGKTLQRFRRFAEDQGVMYIRDVTVDLLEAFKTSGKAGHKGGAVKTNIIRLKNFFKEAYRREWITQPFAQRIQTPHADPEMALPYTDAEITALLEGASALSPGACGRRSPLADNPETFRLLLELQLTTGMRIGDAMTFEPGRLVEDAGHFIYPYTPQKQQRRKRKKVAEAYISAGLKNRIDACPWATPGRFPFYWGEVGDSNITARTCNARHQMERLGVLTGVVNCRFHRLRDTFAVRCLLAGMNLEDVSRLLNHSSIIVTERHYAAWIDERKRRLQRRFVETAMDAISNTSGDAKRNSPRPPKRQP